MSGVNKASAKHDPTSSMKRKPSADGNTVSKRTRMSETGLPNTSSLLFTNMTGGKRKVREDGEGQSQTERKRKRSDVIRCDKELASSSKDTGRKRCNTSMEDVSRRGSKRKAAADGEGPSRVKKKRPDLTENKKKIKEDFSVEAQRADFEARYQEQDQLGKGGCGSVFAGYRKADHLPVAIKHIPKNKIFCKHVDKTGRKLPSEVAVMMKLDRKKAVSEGASAPVSLLDGFNLGQELILVLERPVPSMDLFDYIETKGGSLQEEEAKVIMKQLLDAAINLQETGIFHRDIKTTNILLETGSNVPRVRIIDFGMSCFAKKSSSFTSFYGTPRYAPPEWFRHQVYTAGPTTVWQLGGVLYAMLHRYARFETNMFVHKWLHIKDTLSKDCLGFLMACLNKDPHLRISLEKLQRHPWLR